MRETPNLNYINQLAAGSEEFKQKIICIMKKEFPEEKDVFFSNFKDHNYKDAAENVHKLKHKIGMLGLENGYKTTVSFEEELKGNKHSLYPKFIVILDSINDFLDTL